MLWRKLRVEKKVELIIDLIGQDLIVPPGYYSLPLILSSLYMSYVRQGRPSDAVGLALSFRVVIQGGLQVFRLN